MFRIFIVVFVLHFQGNVFSQAGIQFQLGVSNAINNDKNITPDGMSHPGYFFGADANLNHGEMYFITGLQFHKVDFLPQNESSYFSIDESMNIMKLRVGLGFDLIHLGKKMKLKSKALGILNVINSYPSTLLEEPYTTFNTGTAGVALNVGLEIFSISLEIEYEKGFVNAVENVDDTSFNTLSLNLGWRI